MIRLTRPDADAIATALRGFDPAFSYAEVGATASPEALASLARGYVVDRRRFPLGTGREVFERARLALFDWRHFEIPWLSLEGAGAPVHADQIVATLTRVFGLWFLNPCRVVDRVDPPGEAQAVSFAYGTLQGHVAAGEERFSVRLDPATGVVELEILAFSRPAQWWTRAGRPFMRRVQGRFGFAAGAALARACRRLGAN
ncbi:MAG: DUF1990 domain-containing protein [Deltaproteobacteria bacterium]|nr:DUF1990 domain-containing protein [Deltaproteobacteria bacterium]